MRTIEEYSNYLLNCCFTDDSFDTEDHEDHLETSWELFKSYRWDDSILFGCIISVRNARLLLMLSTL